MAGGGPLGRENVANGLVAYGFAAGTVVLTPTAELRSWTQDGQASSSLANIDLRARWAVGGVWVTPSAGYSTGKVATPASSSPTANLTGYHAALGITLGIP
jgi:hypothetical protein